MDKVYIDRDGSESGSRDYCKVSKKIADVSHTNSEHFTDLIDYLKKNIFR